MFGSKEQYIKAFAPNSGVGAVGPKPPTLAPTRLEELYGDDYSQVLMEAMDDDGLSPEQRILATELLIGTTELKNLDLEEREILDDLAVAMATSSGRVKPQPHPVVRREPKEDPYVEEDDSPWRAKYLEDDNEPSDAEQRTSFFGGKDPYSGAF